METTPTQIAEGEILERLAVNAGGEFAAALPPRDFFVRRGNDADADIFRHVFVDRAYAVDPIPGGETNAARLAEFYARIARAGKRPLIVDAGAMIGATAVYYHLTFPESLVVAVEPERSNFALLQKNCTGLNVQALQGAVASVDTPLFLSDPGGGHHGFRTADEGVYEVPAFPIDRILSEYEEAGYVPFICKINIEGGEAELFSRNVGWLDKFAAIEIELHDWLLPGEAPSRNFFKAIAERNFDFTFYGMEAFCLNNDLLRNFESQVIESGRLERRPEPALGCIDLAMVTGLGDGRGDTARPMSLPPGSRLQIFGWAADPVRGSAGLGIVATAGDLQLNLSSGYGSFRKDVAVALGGNDALAPSGFGISIEASALPEGTYELEVGAIASDGSGYFGLPERLQLVVRRAS